MPPGVAARTTTASLPGAPTSRRAFNASLWIVLGYGTQNVLRFAGNLVLTRLLFPDVFGLSALVWLFVQGLVMFSDVGLGVSVVQSPNGDDPRFMNTAWTIQSVRGIVLALAACLVAHPAAAFYGQPLLAQLIPVAGLNAVFQGFESTSFYRVQRHIELKRLTLVELTSQAAGLVTSIGLSIALRRMLPGNDVRLVWAVICGGLTGSSVRLAFSHLAFAGNPHRWILDRGFVREIVRSGRWVFLSTLLTFLSGQSDRLVFARLIPIDVFGVYNIAVMLSMIPTQLIQILSSRVLFPTYSRHGASGDLAGRFTPLRLPLLLAGATMVSGLLTAGPFLIRLLYDTRYAQAGWIVQYLAVSAWFQLLEATNGAGLLAQGKLPWMSTGSAVKFAGALGLMLLGLRLGGFRGALLGLIASDAAKYLVSVIAMSRQGFRSYRLDLRFSLVVAAVAGLGVLVGGQAAGVAPAAVLTTSRGNLLPLLAAGAVPAVFWGAVSLVWWWRGFTPRPRAA